MRGHMRLDHSSATSPAMSMTAAVTHLRVEVNPDRIARPLALLAHHPVAVRVVHVGIRWVSTAHGSDAVITRFRAGDASVPIVVVQPKSIDGPRCHPVWA